MQAAPSKASRKSTGAPRAAAYGRFVGEVSSLLESARAGAARAVNAVMTAAYWELGRRIVEHEQGGAGRAGYGETILEALSVDLTNRFGRGFSRQNLQLMRLFYLAYPPENICQTLSGKSAFPQIGQTASGKSRQSQKKRTVPEQLDLRTLAAAFRLSWSHYCLLLTRSRSEEARAFYEAEALRGGWSVRQLERQIDSQFYERTVLSRDKAAMLRKAKSVSPDPRDEAVAGAIRDPFVLEFLGLKDEYSESDLEAGLVQHLESFLLELGDDFAFIARQRRLRIGGEWYRVDLVFYHRELRCLVLIDLKLGRFTHADAGQMHLYLNYAREHWTRAGENPPVGLILCANKDAAVARYALEGIGNKILAAEYRTSLPDEKMIAGEIANTRKILEARAARRANRPEPSR